MKHAIFLSITRDVEGYIVRYMKHKTYYKHTVPTLTEAIDYAIDHLMADREEVILNTKLK